MSRRGCALLFAALFAVGSGRAQPESLAIIGGTILDGNGGEPMQSGVIVVDRGRIVAIGNKGVVIPGGARRIEASGKYIIPGMMDANVHLVYEASPEFMLTFESRLEDIAKEAAQVALKHGFTTVFDTWGPLQQLKSVRDQINRGEVEGSRIFLAGNILGVDGPLTMDFYGLPIEGVSEDTLDRINAMWEQGAGREFVYLTPDELRTRIRAYLDKGVDFVKIGVSGHGAGIYGLMSFAPESLRVIVEETRRRGLTVQSHTMTAEALRLVASDAYDLAQHCGTTFRKLMPDETTLQLIPDSTIKLIVDRKFSCTLNAYTNAEIRRRVGENPVDLDSQNSVPVGFNRSSRANVLIAHQNERKLIGAGATILLSTDAGVPWIESPIINRTSPCWKFKGECLHFLGEGHIAWLKAVHEKGMTPMAMLQAATRNIAAAYKKLDELGTLERGKVADLVILNADPLADFANYEQIHLVMKNGKVIDRDALPINKVLTPLNARHLANRSLGEASVPVNK